MRSCLRGRSAPPTHPTHLTEPTHPTRFLGLRGRLSGISAAITGIDRMIAAARNLLAPVVATLNSDGDPIAKMLESVVLSTGSSTITATTSPPIYKRSPRRRPIHRSPPPCNPCIATWHISWPSRSTSSELPDSCRRGSHPLRWLNSSSPSCTAPSSRPWSTPATPTRQRSGPSSRNSYSGHEPRLNRRDNPRHSTRRR